MKRTFVGKHISGILSILPKKESYFEEELLNYTFTPSQSMRLKKIMGYEKHRIVKPSTATSDLCIYGLNLLLDQGYITREEIAAVIVVTITPDHFMPHVSSIIQGECHLPKNVLCMDIMQGCCGFLIGLMQAYMILEGAGNKKVLVINADTLSKKVSKKDRNSYPLIGDAATITVVENDTSAEKIYYTMYMDGERRNALRIPAGGSRLPCSTETARMKEDAEGNIRSQDNLVMDGSSVFTFVQIDVPPMLKEILQDAEVSKDEIDWFIFHQPNQFMLQKLAQKIDVPQEKLFSNIVSLYGNPSGASIPLTVTHNLGERMKHEEFLCCLSAFGEGLSWGAVITKMGEMDFCETVVSDL